jgi:hypothetical protein
MPALNLGSIADFGYGIKRDCHTVALKSRSSVAAGHLTFYENPARFKGHSGASGIAARSRAGAFPWNE